jgi:hypothetical protein
MMKLNKSLDYYVVYHPRAVRAYFQAMKCSVMRKYVYANSILEHLHELARIENMREAEKQRSYV